MASYISIIPYLNGNINFEYLLKIDKTITLFTGLFTIEITI